MPRAKKAVAVKDQLVLTPDEQAAILAIRNKQTSPDPVVESTPGQSPTMAVTDLAQALVQAIEATRPPAKKTTANRKKGDPWQPKDGSPKLKLRRKFYQHGMEINEDTTTNENIERLNKIKPGVYCQGWVRVAKRRSDGGYDITYPVRTVAQRLKLVNTFGITDFGALLDRLIAEKANPQVYRKPEDDEDDE